MKHIMLAFLGLTIVNELMSRITLSLTLSKLPTLPTNISHSHYDNST